LQLDRVGNANAEIMEGFDLDEGCQEFLFNVKQEEKELFFISDQASMLMNLRNI